MALRINSTTVYENGVFRKIDAPKSEKQAEVVKKPAEAPRTVPVVKETAPEVKVPQNAPNEAVAPKVAEEAEKKPRVARMKRVIDGSQVKRTPRKRKKEAE